MGGFKFIKTIVNGIYIIEPSIYKDDRGYFMEIYNHRDFEHYGIHQKFVQDNISISKKGVLRGLHFQRQKPQEKLIRVLHGEIFDVAVDTRIESETFGKWAGFILNEYDNKELFIPAGFAHGFLVLSSTAAVMYKCSDYYNPSDESGIIWDDSDIGIVWPLEKVDSIILSEKDKNWLKLKDSFK